MQFITVKIIAYDRVCHWCGKALIKEAVAVVHQGMLGGGKQPLYCNQDHAEKDVWAKSILAKEPI